MAKWHDLYNVDVDGIDLDIEAGAGDQKVRETKHYTKNYKCVACCIQEAGPNMLHFIRKLKSLVPEMIVSQPVYGYPQVLVMVTLKVGS